VCVLDKEMRNQKTKVRMLKIETCAKNWNNRAKIMLKRKLF